MTADVVRAYLTDNEIEHEEIADGVFTLTLPGEKKLQTPVRLDVGPHALGVHAFVCRKPDENHERVYRWLLARNLKMYAVSFAVDALGDIYLDARLPLIAITPDELDRAVGLGAVQCRRVLQLHPRARLRLLDPQGVGVAQARVVSRPATSRPSAAGSIAELRREASQRAAKTARNARNPGSAWTSRIRRFTVTAP